MLQILPIALAQVKAGNTFENLLNKIRNSMDTIFMCSEDSQTSDPHRLLLNLSDKVNLKRSDKYVALSNLSLYYTWKNIKKVIKK